MGHRITGMDCMDFRLSIDEPYKAKGFHLPCLLTLVSSYQGHDSERRHAYSRWNPISNTTILKSNEMLNVEIMKAELLVI